MVNDCDNKPSGATDVERTSNLPVCEGAAQSKVANFVDAVGLFERISSFIDLFQPGTSEPLQVDALSCLQTLQSVYTCSPVHFECSYPICGGEESPISEPPESIFSLYFVEGSRRLYCLISDNHRTPMRYVIVTRDHSKVDLDQFSVTISGIHENISKFDSGPQSEAIYEMLGNLHQGGQRGFFIIGSS